MNPKLEQHLDLLEKWNKVHNLTAIRNRSEMRIKHTLDSLSVLDHLPNTAGLNLIDVGTGGGFPGIPLAIARPDWQITLVDSNAKKVRFLKHVIAQLHLDNATAVHTRIEQYHPDALFDGVITRAFSAIDNMVALTGHLLKPSGKFYAMKGPETEKLPANILCEHDHVLDVPGLDAVRHLWILSLQKD